MILIIPSLLVLIISFPIFILLPLFRSILLSLLRFIPPLLLSRLLATVLAFVALSVVHEGWGFGFRLSVVSVVVVAVVSISVELFRVLVVVAMVLVIVSFVVVVIVVVISPSVLFPSLERVGSWAQLLILPFHSFLISLLLPFQARLFLWPILHFYELSDLFPLCWFLLHLFLICWVSLLCVQVGLGVD